MKLTSSAFRDGKEIPAVHTCEGSDVSPPLDWAELPSGTRSLALVMDDPDAPDPEAPRVIWTHWVLYNLPPIEGGLPGAMRGEALPAGALPGKNSWNRRNFNGPCPPIGRHRYFFRLFALDAVLPELGVPTREQLLAAAKGHVLATAELMGTYQKQRGQRP